MKRKTFLPLCLLTLGLGSLAGGRLAQGGMTGRAAGLIPADNKDIQYTGRIDFSDPKRPRFWSPGVTVQARFRGTHCEALVNDEVLYGTSHNYLEVVVDGRPRRVQTTGKVNIIPVAAGLPNGIHTVTLCKDTEAGIGYLEFVGFRCDGLAPLPPKPTRRLEFIGDSITCGAGSDLSEHPCGQGQWYDQHNAYLSYGAATARRLGAQFVLTSVSGIGLVHSCCGMTDAMPEVYDRVNLSAGTGQWDVRRYQPDAVTICLGQNDGVQNPVVFRQTYVRFIQALRSFYPHAQIVCLTSPMADPTLTAFLKDNLTQIVAEAQRDGDPNVHAFFFSRSYNEGCGGHPDSDQHQLIANELSASLRRTLGW